MKYLVVVGVVLGAFLLGYLSRPKPEPPRPPPPTKTVVIEVPIPSVPERVQELVFEPGADVPYLVPYERLVFIPDTIPCNEITSRTRIMSAEFGTEYGDTSAVALEKMSYANGSLVFQSSIEKLYTDGMPRRIWTESGLTRVEWIDFPVIRVSSCSIGTKLLSGLVGCGACGLITGFN